MINSRIPNHCWYLTGLDDDCMQTRYWIFICTAYCVALAFQIYEIRVAWNFILNWINDVCLPWLPILDYCICVVSTDVSIVCVPSCPSVRTGSCIDVISMTSSPLGLPSFPSSANSSLRWVGQERCSFAVEGLYLLIEQRAECKSEYIILYRLLYTLCIGQESCVSKHSLWRSVVNVLLEYS